MKQLISQIDSIKELAPELEDAYGKLPREQVLLFSRVIRSAVNKNFNTSIPQVYMKIPKVLNFDEGMIDGQQDPAKTIPQELPKEGKDVDTSKSQWYLEIPKAITAIQWTGNNQQAMEEFCNNGRYRLTDNGDGTLRLADSERTFVINQGDYVASLKSGFSIYKADDFVRDYQFIEKNSDSAPAGFEQESQTPPPAEGAGEGELPPPPSMEATFSITDTPRRMLDKVRSINYRLNKGNWIEKFQSSNIHSTGKQMMSKLPGQEEFDNLIEQNFGIIGKTIDKVKSVAGDILLGTANNAVNGVIKKATTKPQPQQQQQQPAQFNIDNCCPDIGGITAIVIKKHQCCPTIDTQKGINVNQEIDDLLRQSLSGGLMKPVKPMTEEDTMTEIFGIGDKIL